MISLSSDGEAAAAQAGGLNLCGFITTVLIIL
jgi:hypothetical protein